MGSERKTLEDEDEESREGGRETVREMWASSAALARLRGQRLSVV